MPPPEVDGLRAKLLELFAMPVDRPLDDAAFDAHALDVFRFQYERNAPYAAFCRRRGRTPSAVGYWSEIPAAPTAAFREVALVAGDATAAQAVFRTSGTTRGRRGTHYILDLSIYHASLLPNFAARVLPDGVRPLVLSLVPSARELTDSSLAHMIDTLMQHFGAAGSRHVASAAHGFDEALLRRTLRDAEAGAQPVCLLGTAFSFVHWLDALADSNVRFRLPPGSRIMDTGGYKGRSREVPEDALRREYGSRLGVAPEYCVNEYGMTELCSQFYDGTLSERRLRGHPRTRRKVGPPWVRTMVVDPDTLEPVPEGRTGLLRHIDLANLYSVAAVQTEDLGHSAEDGFALRGRAAGAMPRGCSIAMDDLLSAARGER